MAYFRSLPNLQTMLDLFHREDDWLIPISADPDAMASAMALKRIMSRRVRDGIDNSVNLLQLRAACGGQPRQGQVERWDYDAAMQCFRRIAVHPLEPGDVG